MSRHTSFRVLESLPEAEVRRFCLSSQGPSTDGDLVVEFSPESRHSWIGHFEGIRSHAPMAPSAAYALGERQWLLVLSRGQAWAVNVTSPGKTTPVGRAPVNQAIHVPQAGTAVLADSTDIDAFDSNRPRWRSGRVSWDGIRDLPVRDNLVTAQGWNAPGDGWQPIEIDIRTGKIIRSTYP